MPHAELISPAGCKGFVREPMVAANLPPAVEAPETAVSVEEFPIGEEEADVRPRVVVPNASKKRLRCLSECGIGWIADLAWRLVIGEQHAEGCRARLAGQLRAEARINDRASVNDRRTAGTGHVVDVPSFEKERPQFRVLNGETLVDFDLLAVGLDLR